MKKEKLKGAKRLNAFITALEILLLLVLILGYLTQFIVYTSRTIMYFTNNDKYDTYTEIFYDKSLEGKTDEDNFEYLYNLTTNYDRDLVKSGAVLDSEITIFSWTALLIKVLGTIAFILICEIIRRLTQEENIKESLTEEKQAIFKKLKLSLMLIFITLFIANLVIATLTPFETDFLKSTLIYLILYSLVELVYFLTNQNKPKLKNK